MKDLHVRFPYELRVRVNLAAAAADCKATDYVRRQLGRWLQQDPLPILDPVEGENLGSNQRLRFSVNDSINRRIRTLAIEQDISYAALLARILHATTPHPTELLLEAATGAPRGLR